MADSYLILGRAKTGTTVISKNIQNSIPNSKFFSEPKTESFFESRVFVCSEPRVVKVIFEHWDQRSSFRNDMVRNRTNVLYKKIVSITRDPRDTLISGLFYIAYPQIYSGQSAASDFSDWINLLKRKEAEPDSVSLKLMLDTISGVIGYDLLKSFKLGLERYSGFCNENVACMFNVRYEDFISGRKEGLEDYLGFKLSDNEDVGRLKRTKRTSSFNNWKSLLLEEDSAFLKKELGALMLDTGYSDWELGNESFLDSEHGSKYVARLIKEAKRRKTAKSLFSSVFHK